MFFDACISFSVSKTASGKYPFRRSSSGSGAAVKAGATLGKMARKIVSGSPSGEDLEKLRKRSGANVTKKEMYRKY